MAGEFRYIPQETLDDITRLVNPVLDAIVPFVPYLAVAAVVPFLLRAMMQWKLEASRGSFLDDATERKLRSVPLSVGIWGLFFMHLFLVLFPGVMRSFAATEGPRALIEVMTMGFAFFTMFGLLNVVLRWVLEVDVRRKLGKLGLLDMLIIATVLLPALGVMLYAWATIRWASVWTGQVMWQTWINAFTFDFSHNDMLKQMPVFMKLHMIVFPLASAHIFLSRLVTHLMIPRPSLIRMGNLRTGGEGEEEEFTVRKAAAWVAGVSAEKEHK
ncbi:MAG: respiratory nitrate reductase subunit gamma [Planctomycetes bacterium]|nr:respiratory nitrate reductase subunit gamma [Planctomycetota bacterium]